MIIDLFFKGFGNGVHLCLHHGGSGNTHYGADWLIREHFVNCGLELQGDPIAK